MIAAVVVLLLNQVEVRPLAIHGGRASRVELRAANDRFVWFQVPFEGGVAGGGGSLYRLDRLDGGLHPMASASFLDFSDVNEPGQLPRTWADEDLIRSSGIVDRFGFHPFPDNLRTLATTPSRALLARADGGGLQLLRAEDGTRSALNASARGPAYPLSDGRLVAEVNPSDGGTGVLIVSPDGGTRFFAYLTISARLRKGPVFAAFDGLFTEDGTRLGDFAVDPGNSPVMVTATNQALRVTDGSGPGVLLTTNLDEIRFSGAAMGLGFVAFPRNRQPGLIVESLSGGGRVVNANAPEGSLVVSGGRVRYEFSELEVFADGGLGPWKDDVCGWRSLELGAGDETCFVDGGLLRRASSDGPVTTLAEGLEFPGGLPQWNFATQKARQRTLLFGTGAFTHWTDGERAYVLGTGETILFEAQNKLVLETDGVTLLDPVTEARTSFGLPLTARPVRAERALLVSLPSCRLLQLSLDGSSTEVAQICPDSLVETPGGALLLTPEQHWWWNARRGTFDRVQMPLPDPNGLRDLPGPQVHRATFGETAWVTTSMNSTIAIDVPSGRIVRSLPSANTVVTGFGAIVDTPVALIWDTLQGPSFPFSSGSSFALSPARLKAGAGAAWVLGSEVQATTGGQPTTLPFKQGTRWAGAHPVAASLVLATETGLEVLDVDGGQRTVPLRMEPESARFAGDRLWFVAHDDAHGFEPWFFDGVTARLAADLLPGPASSFPRYVGALDRGVVVQAARADGLIGAVALLLDPPAPELPPLPPPSGCGCKTTAGLEALIALGWVVRRRRTARIRGYA